jgi:formylmethanofuran dehydrogenase subunit B
VTSQKREVKLARGFLRGYAVVPAGKQDESVVSIVKRSRRTASISEGSRTLSLKPLIIAALAAAFSLMVSGYGKIDPARI